MKSLGLGRSGESGLDVGLAVTAMNRMLPHEQGQDVEMMAPRHRESDKESELSSGPLEEEKAESLSSHAR